MVEIVHRSQVTCPKCKGSYVYEYVPGGSLTAIRLGTARYMRCALCHKFAIFELSANRIRPEQTIM